MLYSGTFEAYQGLSELVDAIPLVRARMPNVQFVFVGADRANGAIAGGTAAGLVESGVLTVVERQPRNQMAAFLALADVLVSPRAYGGNLPLKIFDYLAAGRPIVATDIPTHRTVLTEERAVLVEPAAESIAAGILGVLGDPARARRLAAAARSYAQTHFGWRRFVDSVDTLYAEVARHASVTRAERLGPGHHPRTQRRSDDRQSDQHDSPPGARRAGRRGRGGRRRIHRRHGRRGSRRRARGCSSSATGQEAATLPWPGTGGRAAARRSRWSSSTPTACRRRAGSAACWPRTKPAHGGRRLARPAERARADGALRLLLRVVPRALAPPGRRGPEPSPRQSERPPRGVSRARGASPSSSRSPTRTRSWPGRRRCAAPAAVSCSIRRPSVYHYNRPGSGNLLRRNYRWGYSAIEGKAPTGAGPAAWVYRYPGAARGGEPADSRLGSAGYITWCWLRARRDRAALHAARVARRPACLLGRPGRRGRPLDAPGARGARSGRDGNERAAIRVSA